MSRIEGPLARRVKAAGAFFLLVCACGAVLVAAGARSRPDVESHQHGSSADDQRRVQFAAGSADGSVCLEADGFKIMSRDVQELRAAMSPPPAWDQAVDFAVDVSLLYASRHPEVSSISMPERRRDYMRLAKETRVKLKTQKAQLEELQRMRDTTHRRLRARRYNCSPPREG